MKRLKGKTCAIIGEDIKIESINRCVLYDVLKNLVYKQKVRNFIWRNKHIHQTLQSISSMPGHLFKSNLCSINF